MANSNSTTSLSSHKLCYRCRKRPAAPGQGRCAECAEKYLAIQRAWHARQKAQGLCPRCKQPSAPGYSHCEKHLGLEEARREQKRTGSECLRCKEPAAPNRKFCPKHLHEACTTQLQKYDRCKLEGVCYVCSQPYHAEGQPVCSSCQTDRQNYRLLIKLEVLEAYGGLYCTCCGEHRPEFLTIEHPDGDGADHREELTGDRRCGGWQFYAKLKKAGFPKDRKIVVHCMNCNDAKGVYGYCPHDLERQNE